MNTSFISKISVELVQSAGGDEMVVAAAKVSTSGQEALKFTDKDANYGLIKYLMKHRHGCYDSLTEVLTDEGWKFWPEVTGQELFATLSKDNKIEYQKAERVVHKELDGHLLRIKKHNNVDALVTFDHNMLAARRKNDYTDSDYQLVPARHLLDASHRIKMGGGEWDSSKEAKYMKLIGFIIGDGHVGTSISFRLRKDRKIKYLKRIAEEAGIAVTENQDRFYLVGCSELLKLAKECYTQDKKKQIPKQLLDCSKAELNNLFEGLMQSDGSVSKTGRQSYSTNSKILADQMQELCMKIGRAATVRRTDRINYFTNELYTIYRISVFNDKGLQPRIGWTSKDRQKEVTLEKYTGQVHCVTVPNGTLYVRRNGVPMWCGNTPFEHNLQTFFVHAPQFVWWEWTRHRIGVSFNLESSRYKQLDPVFWIPNFARPLRPAPDHKSARPKFVSDVVLADKMRNRAKKVCELAYAEYAEAIEEGVANEVARTLLPSSIYFSGWVSFNARSLMHFLSLRTHEPEATYTSYPQAEIEEAARVVEEVFEKGWPLTYKAFNECGRVGA
jgi:thymidylate synthase (FAD)